MRAILAALIIVTSSACSGRSERIVLDHTREPTVTGTFSNLRVDGRGVFGVELRIAVTQKPEYQAVVQFGGGEFCEARDHGSEPCFRVSNLILAEAQFDWQKKLGDDSYTRLRLPPSSGHEAVFEGWVSRSTLTGDFSFPDGRILHVVLQRGPSYWDGAGKT
jgi:hypothetical protein